MSPDCRLRTVVVILALLVRVFTLLNGVPVVEKYFPETQCDGLIETASLLCCDFFLKCVLLITELAVIMECRCLCIHLSFHM